MKKIVKATAAQMAEMTKDNKKERLARAKAAPEFSVDEIPEMQGFVPNRTIRGFAAFKEYINKNGRPPVADKQQHISIRLPESITQQMKGTKNYSRHLSDYIVAGWKSGKLKFPQAK